ncbi:MAG: hypothetical protein U9R50_06175 [Campylobacterota bacterium]|nr:hypothetical protein [Campylobacterota bacterium]
MNYFFLPLLLTLLFTGCNINDFIPKEPDSPEIRKKALELQHQQELAKLASQKELASIDLQKQVELGKMDKDVRLKALELQNIQEIEKLKLQEDANKAQREYAMKRNMVLLAALLLLLLAFGIYILFKRRHENKLHAYNDNLQKYFYQKENESRVKLAEKIIDTVAEGKASPDQEGKLLSILQGTSHSSTDKLIDTVPKHNI